MELSIPQIQARARLHWARRGNMFIARHNNLAMASESSRTGNMEDIFAPFPSSYSTRSTWKVQKPVVAYKSARSRRGPKAKSWTSNEVRWSMLPKLAFLTAAGSILARGPAAQSRLPKHCTTPPKNRAGVSAALPPAGRCPTTAGL